MRNHNGFDLKSSHSTDDHLWLSIEQAVWSNITMLQKNNRLLNIQPLTLYSSLLVRCMVLFCVIDFELTVDIHEAYLSLANGHKYGAPNEDRTQYSVVTVFQSSLFTIASRWGIAKNSNRYTENLLNYIFTYSRHICYFEMCPQFGWRQNLNSSVLKKHWMIKQK